MSGQAIPDPVAPARSKPETPLARFVRSFFEDKLAIIGLVVFVAIALLAFAAPLLMPQNPYDLASLDIMDGGLPPGSESYSGMTYWLGTDPQGRDMLSAIFYGLRISLIVAFISLVLAITIGVVAGTTAAYFGGRIDEAIMRIIDAIMSIPNLLMALLIVSLLGNSSANAVLAIGLASTPAMARITRSVALAVRKQDYINAAIARGESGTFIVLREMLPNVIAPIIVEFTIRVSFAVMMFATLSYLGLGTQPPAPEWGLMVAEARRFMHLSPWMIIWPSVALAFVAIGFNLLGDGLRDALNPRT